MIVTAFTAPYDDGDTVELDETHRLVLHIDHDPFWSINDYDCDGRVSDYFEYWRDGKRERPAGFTGRARKIDADRSGYVWWEPYDDLMGWQDDAGEWHHGKWEQLPPDAQRKEVRRITELIQYGFKQVGLELQQLVSDERGGEHWVEVGTAWLGGCDSVYPELIDDLYAEVMPL
jgi:hypothetical protein